MPGKIENYKSLYNLSKNMGIDLFGVGNLENAKIEFLDLSSKITENLKYGISMGIKLSNSVIEEISDRPTKLYFHHYRQINNLLDQTALKISNVIQNEGWTSLSIPASQVIDWKNQRGHFQHKIVAYQAGLGWIGRNNLIVNPEFGSRVRYVSILTDMPLEINAPLKKDCGDCKNCLDVCPAGAIEENYRFDRDKCLEKLRWFSKKYNIGHYICGICLKVCSGFKDHT